MPIVRNVDDLWPEVFYELGLVRSRLMRKVLDFLAWLSYIVPAAVAPISARYKRWIVVKYGVPSERVHVVEVGVDRVESLNVDRNSNERFVVMYSGVLGPAYDFDVILEAAKILESYGEIVFVIRGDGELRKEIIGSVRKQRIGNVVMLGKVKGIDKVVEYLNLTDVFVLPMMNVRVSETAIPSKVYEFLACGKTVICSTRGELANLLHECRAGLAIGPGDSEALAKAVSKLNISKSLRIEMGENARKAVLERFSNQEVGRKLESILQGVRSRSHQIQDAQVTLSNRGFGVKKAT